MLVNVNTACKQCHSYHLRYTIIAFNNSIRDNGENVFKARRCATKLYLRDLII